ncbi:MAG: inositol monophosphatase, partial [Candidatus Dormibacteria bacterium]
MTELELALRLADTADAITLARFRATDLDVRTKSDGSPVSDADSRTEEALRAILQRERPEHAIVGEEMPPVGDAPWRWYLDPVDGTVNYVRGVPVWGTLIALHHDDEPVCAVVSAPALHRRWWAQRGAGAFTNGDQRLHVSRTRRLADAYISTTDIGDLWNRGFGSGFEAVAMSSGRRRAFGDFWQHMLVAEGAIDVAIEAVVRPWDLAAPQLIVEEA